MTVFATGLVWSYVRLMRAVPRAHYENFDALETAIQEGNGVIIAFWHQRLILSPVLVPKVRPTIVHMLVSMNRDGDIMAGGASVPGVKIIRGSAANPTKRFKDKSGAPALIQMIGALEGGDCVALTPDGPRGPAQLANPGIIKLASRTGSPIVPVGLAASGGRYLKTWDRAFLPNPFSRKIGVIGSAIAIPKQLDQSALDQYVAQLNSQLNSANERADTLARADNPTSL